MSCHKNLIDSKKSNASFLNGGFAGFYCHMGREVLLSEVSSECGESMISMDIELPASREYRFSFLF